MNQFGLRCTCATLDSFTGELISEKRHDNNKGLNQTVESNVDPYLSLLSNRMEAVKHKFSAEYFFFFFDS